MAFGFITGLFAAEDYFLVKNLIANTKSVLLPLCICAFSNPVVPLIILRTWNKFILFFVIAVIPLISHDTYAFVLPPFYYLYAHFLNNIKNKWFWITLFAIAIIATGLENRSAVIKLAFSLILLIGLMLDRFIPNLLLKCGHFTLFVAPIIFFILGVTGEFNIFQGFPKEEDNIIVYSSNGQIEDQDTNNSSLSSDTRTFMYVEVLTSAIINDYVICGRSLSRGNDSGSIGAVEAEISGTGRMERNFNEAEILNIFTWLGLIGTILFSSIYLHCSTLALYFSKNKYIKYLGLSVAFHWAYSWIEEGQSFRIMDFTLWIIIAMCASPQFRQMTNKEFEIWIASLFTSRTFTPYHKLTIAKKMVRYLLIKK